MEQLKSSSFNAQSNKKPFYLIQKCITIFNAHKVNVTSKSVLIITKLAYKYAGTGTFYQNINIL